MTIDTEKQDTIEQECYNLVKKYMDEDGWFPDSVLGQSFWALTYCTRKQVGDEIYWKFVKEYE